MWEADDTQMPVSQYLICKKVKWEAEKISSMKSSVHVIFISVASCSRSGWWAEVWCRASSVLSTFTQSLNHWHFVCVCYFSVKMKLLTTGIGSGLFDSQRWCCGTWLFTVTSALEATSQISCFIQPNNIACLSLLFKFPRKMMRKMSKQDSWEAEMRNVKPVLE